MLVTKIQRPKIFKLKKKNDLLITKKQKQKKKKQKKENINGWNHDTCACIFDESVGGAGNTQWGKGSHTMSVACFNYSIAEVWTANTCLTTAC